MRLLVLRHAQAVPQGTRGLADRDRPLTPEGERRFRRSAQSIARALPAPDLVLTSPLVRARQTAALLVAEWGGGEPTLEPALAGGSVESILDALDAHRALGTVAIVGHEPTVSALAAELLAVTASDAIAFEPGAAALFEITSVATRRGRLVWFVPPDVAQ